MQTIIVDEKKSNIKIEKYLQEIYPNLSFGNLQKAFRKKDIKVNGIRVGRDYLIKRGDKLEIYISDEFLHAAGISEDTRMDPDKAFRVVYEDDNILLVNKEQGIPVHPDRGQSKNTLIDLVREYLRGKNEYTTGGSNFQPALCHRLDRNTGGLVIIAKNQASLDIMLDKLESREVIKYYQCMVKGKMEKPEAILKAYLWKDASRSRVFVNNQKTTGSLEIITGYKVIKYDPEMDISLLEVELITGRTHQIRAHLAFIGHPVIGDGKYGTNAINRFYGLKQQALWAYKLRFMFSKQNTVLSYLNGREFKVDAGFNIGQFTPH